MKRSPTPVRIPFFRLFTYLHLARKAMRKYIPQAESDDLLAALDAVAVVVDELPEVRLSPDPDDNPILATAIAGKADLVVSGDKKDMLAIGNVKGIPIVTAREAADLTDG